MAGIEVATGELIQAKKEEESFSGFMKVSMDGLRTHLTWRANDLGNKIRTLINDLGIDYEADDLVESFDELACSVNSLNCVYSKDMDEFTMLIDQESVDLISDVDD